MAMYCEICGEELAPEDEEEWVCQSCKISSSRKFQEEKEEINDPSIT